MADKAATGKNTGRTLKSSAKAAGLKSAFVLGEGKVLITSFGKGNKAVREKRVVGGRMEPIAETPALQLGTAEEKGKFTVSGRVFKGALEDDPLRRRVTPDDPQQERPEAREDSIRLKAKLEERFFGATFGDNIHIQLIYNVLDIDKLLSEHVNNSVYAINNLMRVQAGEGFDDKDLIAYLRMTETYEKFVARSKKAVAVTNKTYDDRKTAEVYELFCRLIDSPRLKYTGDLLWNEAARASAKKEKYEDRKTEKLEAVRADSYYLLDLLGMLRQAVTHSDLDSRIVLYQPIITKKTKNGAGAWMEASRVLNAKYTARIEKLNRDFVENARKKDLPLLFALLNVQSYEEKREIVRQYYDFIVRKEQKNLGFSVKTLRQTIKAELAPELGSDDYASVRQKLHHMLDFMLTQIYLKDGERLAALVEKLRAVKEEEEKEAVYVEEAKRVWPELKDRVYEQILPSLSADVIGAIAEDTEVSEEMIAEIAVPAAATDFSKLVWLLTNFLDGKEINILLTQLISKLESIASFLEVMKAEEIPCGFTPEYSLLAESEKIAGELRLINSFARMTGKSADAKKEMFREAMLLLGYPEKDSGGLSAYLDTLLDKKQGERLSNGKKDNTFRNFIAANVIESDRFKYLVRYGNPEKLRKLAENRAVVLFVLGDIPDTQILRNYNSVTGEKAETCTKEMRETLADKLTGLSFEKLKLNASAKQNVETEHKKALVRLYLTVLYLLTKNLVYVNARFALGFHCAERDACLTDKKYAAEYGAGNPTGDLRAFARDFIGAHPLNKHAMEYLEQNFANSDAWSVRAFRNLVMHQNVLRNAGDYIGDIRQIRSYYSLYQYLAARMLSAQLTFDKRRAARKPGEKHLVSSVNPATLKYLEWAESRGDYRKDFVKALCVPFCYNLPRYKNLAIEELFDRNRPVEKGGKALKEFGPEEV